MLLINLGRRLGCKKDQVTDSDSHLTVPALSKPVPLVLLLYLFILTHE